MRLVLPLPPSINSYWRSIGRGRVLVSAEGREYREKCALIALGQKAKPLSGDVRVVGTVYFENRRRDLDNTLKALLDSLAGVCYENDRQIAEIHIRRAFNRLRPRVELEIEQIEEAA